jgi:dicarboxylate transporter 10
MRQATYSTVRFGMYEEMKHSLGPSPSSAMLIVTASSAGFVGGVAGNFADVINVRMQNDAALPAEKRRKYKHVFDGMVRIARQEGLPGCFRGWVPNSSRAAVQTAGQLASYDSIKRVMIESMEMSDNLSTQLSASFLAGVIATTATNPIDVIKSRVMSSAGNDSLLSVIRSAFRNDSIRWVFRGWLPSFLRIGP